MRRKKKEKERSDKDLMDEQVMKDKRKKKKTTVQDNSKADRDVELKEAVIRVRILTIRTEKSGMRSKERYLLA